VQAARAVGERLERVLGRRLRTIAQAKGLPLSHVADRAGVARSYLWRLLAGGSSATLAAVQRLAEVLDVAPLALLSDDEGATTPATPRRSPKPVTASGRTSPAPRHRRRDE
jgi:transcriptional regulator with XRE-family HTH domain